MSSDSVKPEFYDKRPSPLSEWYRRMLHGKEFTICDFDWFIQKRFQKSPNNLIIIEEKTVKSFDNPLCITLGEAYLFNNLLSIIKEDITLPIYIVFIEGTDFHSIYKGVFFCKYKTNYLVDCNKIKIKGFYNLDLTPKCKKLSEEELILKIINSDTKMEV